MSHPLEELKIALRQAVASEYALDLHRNRLAVIETLFPISDGSKTDYVSRGWLETLNIPDLDSRYGKLSWKELYEILRGEPDYWIAAPVLMTEERSWLHDQGHRDRIWYGVCDYGATGEGSTMVFVARYALTEAMFIADLVEKEGAYMAQGYEVSSEFPTGHVVDFLVTEKMKRFLTSEPDAYVNVRLESHFNYS